MADTITKDKRSWNMSRIHSKDTSIEVKLRKALFKEGFRYRKNVKELPGKPDLVLPKYKTVIFIHGCYWHHHNCKEFHIPKTNQEFWKSKFDKNVKNDALHTKELQALGWQVIVAWECEIEKDFENTLTRVKKQILNYDLD